MMKNTGNNKHDGCPPQMPNEYADTKRVDCLNLPISPALLATGLSTDVIDARVPLTDLLVEADVEADIYLPTAAREIKNIRKNVSLKQCKTVESAADPTGFTLKLYLTGVVHKNIQYVEHHTGYVKDYAVDVPFTCNQTVFIRPATGNPVVYPLGLQYSLKNSTLELRELADDGHSADRCTGGSLSFEIYNEPVECKMIASAVKEVDLYKDFDHFGRFSKITEKMEVLLLFKLWQRQQITIDDTPHGGGSTADDAGAVERNEGQTALERFKQAIRRASM
ncbi:hypothetical protein EJF36_13225 [Bacillus sp. HMF5848]|uniref:CsxC family protein n=1 Tax=Bacillus sp. HMF5848 TaxID=2495421 RepID=UPI000F76F2E5|nr:hypothetical protein [Bacillus sp. HMF5848]RSK27758.1 hypothetical protein EJF36_13225 [Bacillus sp. HMF5848]